jgi:transcriptional regulator with XRE-family HTH domain
MLERNSTRPNRTPTHVDEHVGLRIREARLAADLSQTGLGAKIGVTFQQVQKYEKGANRVGCGRLQQIADALDRPITWFFAAASGTRPNGKPDPMQTFASSAPGQRLAPFFNYLDKDTQRTVADLVERVARRQRQLTAQSPRRVAGRPGPRAPAAYA